MIKKQGFHVDCQRELNLISILKETKDQAKRRRQRGEERQYCAYCPCKYGANFTINSVPICGPVCISDYCRENGIAVCEHCKRNPATHYDFDGAPLCDETRCALGHPTLIMVRRDIEEEEECMQGYGR